MGLGTPWPIYVQTLNIAGSGTSTSSTGGFLLGLPLPTSSFKSNFVDGSSGYGNGNWFVLFLIFILVVLVVAGNMPNKNLQMQQVGTFT